MENRVFQLSANGLIDFSRNLFDIAQNTNSSFDDVAEVAREFSKKELETEEVLTRTKSALLLMKSAGLSIKNSVELLTLTIELFNKDNLDSTKIINKLEEVDRVFSISANDLGEALVRSGKAAEEAGITITELTNMIEKAQRVTSRGGAAIGNALKTVLSRLETPLVRSQFVFSGVEWGISEKISSGELLHRIAKTYKEGNTLQKQYIAETLGGVYQANVVAALFA